MIKQENQRELITLIELFNTTPKLQLKENIRTQCEIYQKANRAKSTVMANKIGIKLQTFYFWKTPCKDLTPNFENALKLCEVLNISIYKLLRGDDLLQTDITLRFQSGRKYLLDKELESLKLGYLYVGKNRIYFENEVSLYVVEEFEFISDKGKDLYSTVEGFSTIEEAVEVAIDPNKYRNDLRNGV